MEKKTISVHAFTVHIYTIAIVILLLCLAVLGVKYLHLKTSVQKYMQSTIWMNSQQRPNGQVSDYAAIIATSASQYVAQPQLQTYVLVLSKQLSRDIVVMDRSQKILADSIPTNDGAQYTYDAKGEIKMTLADGNSRTFFETSTDYPSGIQETVVPMRDANNAIIGAVLISTSTISK